ncbi:MAG: hypothetical protein LBR53_03305 [Deltaproteobacteria bacterium]|jgi:hypothetical protein|nr:hypothetical protein [Deltaproteobacteria bacterium]
MSEELVVFLNFEFKNNLVATKILDDVSLKLSSASRHQLNWRAYLMALEKIGVYADCDKRPLSGRYLSPQSTDELYKSLIAFQEELRLMLREIVAKGRVSRAQWKKIFRESDSLTASVSPPVDFDSDITSENFSDLKLRLNYDGEIYRSCVMANLRDLIVSGRIFDVGIDPSGLFYIKEPSRFRAEDAPRENTRPREAAPAAAGGPLKLPGVKPLRKLAEESEDTLDLSALADRRAFSLFVSPAKKTPDPLRTPERPAKIWPEIIFEKASPDPAETLSRPKRGSEADDPPMGEEEPILLLEVVADQDHEDAPPPKTASRDEALAESPSPGRETPPRGLPAPPLARTPAVSPPVPASDAASGAESTPSFLDPAPSPPESFGATQKADGLKKTVSGINVSNGDAAPGTEADETPLEKKLPSPENALESADPLPLLKDFHLSKRHPETEAPAAETPPTPPEAARGLRPRDASWPDAWENAAPLAALEENAEDAQEEILLLETVIDERPREEEESFSSANEPILLLTEISDAPAAAESAGAEGDSSARASESGRGGSCGVQAEDAPLEERRDVLKEAEQPPLDKTSHPRENRNLSGEVPPSPLAEKPEEGGALPADEEKDSAEKAPLFTRAETEGPDLPGLPAEEGEDPDGSLREVDAGPNVRGRSQPDEENRNMSGEVPPSPPAEKPEEGGSFPADEEKDSVEKAPLFSRAETEGPDLPGLPAEEEEDPEGSLREEDADPDVFGISFPDKESHAALAERTMDDDPVVGEGAASDFLETFLDDPRLNETDLFDLSGWDDEEEEEDDDLLLDDLEAEPDLAESPRAREYREIDYEETFIYYDDDGDYDETEGSLSDDSVYLDEGEVDSHPPAAPPDFLPVEFLLSTLEQRFGGRSPFNGGGKTLN